MLHVAPPTTARLSKCSHCSNTQDICTMSSTDCSGTAVAPADVNVVIYHGGCWDGFGAAYAVWTVRRDAATYIPRSHSPEHKAADDILPLLVGKHVLVVDYCFPLAVTLRIMAVAASLLVLDHHATAKDDL